ncbi:MAG TPA: DUF1800 domain-containing protein [Gemmataceae bacterium]|nr:DUF1800 domain-containing protein [Gemmataceae bacterium]
MAVMLPPLDQLDPADAWAPWRPTATDPWNRKWAAHLYRRAAFGANRAELIQAVRLGPDATLDALFRGGAIRAGKPGVPGVAEANRILDETLEDIGRIAADRDDAGQQIRGWWLYVILQGGHPLREKMTLFWHNHFATSIAKVQNPLLMFRQNCLLRHHALDHFGALLQGISRDPAMLFWLDGNSNVKGRPNENYARELMELFSLGVGHYTEKDVRAGARAFTGWHTDSQRFRFDTRVHDDGSKTFLGRTGPWNGGDILHIILAQPACARFLVRKLYHYLISESTDPPDALLEPLCKTFRQSNYDVAALVRTMLASRLFYSEHAFRQRIKSPVEYVVGAVRAVYGAYPEGDPDYQPLPPQVLVRWVNDMGQRLFAPPNVKGWPGAQAWLNTSTVLERDNFAAALASGSLWSHAPAGATPPKAFDAARVVHEEGARGAEDAVRVLLDLYVPGGVRPTTRTKLVAFVANGSATGPTFDQRVREAVHAILTMPEYQLA